MPSSLAAIQGCSDLPQAIQWLTNMWHALSAYESHLRQSHHEVARLVHVAGCMLQYTEPLRESITTLTRDVLVRPTMDIIPPPSPLAGHNWEVVCLQIPWVVRDVGGVRQRAPTTNATEGATSGTTLEDEDEDLRVVMVNTAMGGQPSTYASMATTLPSTSAARPMTVAGREETTALATADVEVSSVPVWVARPPGSSSSVGQWCLHGYFPLILTTANQRRVQQAYTTGNQPHTLLPGVMERAEKYVGHDYWVYVHDLPDVIMWSTHNKICLDADCIEHALRAGVEVDSTSWGEHTYPWVNKLATRRKKSKR
jgi:hypothetical protein